MKNFMKNFIMLSTIFLMVGCGSYQNLKPTDQVVADAVIVESIGAFLDQNGQYKPVVKDITTQGLALLNSTTIATQSGVATWVNDQISSRLGTDNPRLKRLVSVIVIAYMPGWSDSLGKVLSQTDRDTLNHLGNLILMATS